MIRTSPYCLNISNEDAENCPCCKDVLIKSIKKGQRMTGFECGYCRYLDRPFGCCGNSAENQYGGCYCKYEDCEYIEMICYTCEKGKLCEDCSEIVKCCNANCSAPLKCKKCTDKINFKAEWRTSSPHEKVEYYGVAKLRLLARYKKLKNRSKMNKYDLIKALSPLVDKDDFPIR